MVASASSPGTRSAVKPAHLPCRARVQHLSLGASLTEEEGMASTSSEGRGLLRRWSAGDESARDRLIPLVCDRLRQLAHRRLGDANVERSLNTTALVHQVGGLSLEESAAAIGEPLL